MQRLIWIKPPGTVLAQYLNQWGSKSQTLDYWNYLNTTILCLLCALIYNICIDMFARIAGRWDTELVL